MGKRTDVDFSKHELRIVETEECKIHWLKIPNSSFYNCKFINCGGVLSVTGDLNNWIFCREFHPSKDNYVSDHYWLEKLRMSSSQNPYDFDSDTARAQIVDEYKDYLENKEVKEWLRELKSAAIEGEFAFHAKQYDYPSGYDTEGMPNGNKVNCQLEVVFDAFEEICRRLTEGVC